MAQTRTDAPAAVWVRALRLPTLGASLVPVLLGVALGLPARDALGAWLWLPAVLGCALLQLGSNLLNDLGDYQSGVDHEGALGGSGVLPEHLLFPSQVARAGWACFGLAAVLGAGLLVARGLPMLVLGTLGLLGGWGYTAGPRYKYLGLGDLFVFVLLGPLTALGGYVAVAGTVASVPLLAAVPAGLLITATLHSNNVRDLEADRDSGLATVALWLGRRGSLRYFALLVFGAYAALPLLALFRVLPWTALLPLLTLPLALRAVADLAQAESVEARRERPLVEQTARLHLAFGLLLVVGGTLGGLFGN
jgi:1,4-dihydroxy-2-naphthoate octaprenyltransferase